MKLTEFHAGMYIRVPKFAYSGVPRRRHVVGCTESLLMTCEVLEEPTQYVAKCTTDTGDPLVIYSRKDYEYQVSQDMVEVFHERNKSLVLNEYYNTKEYLGLPVLQMRCSQKYKNSNGHYLDYISVDKVTSALGAGLFTESGSNIRFIGRNYRTSDAYKYASDVVDFIKFYGGLVVERRQGTPRNVVPYTAYVATAEAGTHTHRLKSYDKQSIDEAHDLYLKYQDFRRDRVHLLSDYRKKNEIKMINLYTLPEEFKSLPGFIK